MRRAPQQSLHEQVDFLRRQFLQDGELPLTDVLTEELIAPALSALTGWPDRYEPRVKKRRKDYCGWMTRPRAELKRKMAKGLNRK